MRTIGRFYAAGAFAKKCIEIRLAKKLAKYIEIAWNTRVANLIASCPSCGAEVSFRTAGAAVVVCEYCHSVIARTDRELESLGKVAELVETGSPLALGLKGAFRNVAFDLVGRAQMRHAAGGIWDEWYAHFDDGRWGWLAEAQGRFYLTFALEGFDKPLPTYEHARTGTNVDALPGFVVAERGTAHAESAQGEIPWKLVPNESFRFADLSGTKKSFATIDWSFEPPAVFAGWETTLGELGLGAARAPEREARKVSAATVGCPKCGGALELRAPDVTERVACPYCGSLLETSEGALRFLKALKKGPIEPRLPLGATGSFEGTRLTVIGFLVRSVTWEGERFAWSEYLLYEPRLGFRWLVEGDGHWSYVRPVAAAEPKERGQFAVYDGTTFTPFQQGEAKVDEIRGELYWKVEIGEKVKTFDRIAVPRMLSKEWSDDEVNWSISEYVPVASIEKNFGVKNLPRPAKAGAIQPNPVGSQILVFAAILVALAISVSVVLWGTFPNRVVFSKAFPLEAQAATEGTQVFFTDPFTLEGNRNLSVIASTRLAENNWVYVDGDFYQESSGTAQTFALPIEHYSGYEDGESWSEGGLSSGVHLSALPAGEWTMRLEISKGLWNQAGTLDVEVREGVIRFSHLLILLGFLLAPPAVALIRRSSFETQRWADADFTPSGTARDTDDGDDE